MSYISAELRQFVIERAGGCCEYCRMSQEDRLISFAIDHIRAIKHGGKDDGDNLCFACFKCNGFKGTDLMSIDPMTDEPAFLFNPRKQVWDDHFRLNGVDIEALTSEGRATAFLLRFNSTVRIKQRGELIKAGRYPCITKPKPI